MMPLSNEQTELDGIKRLDQQVIAHVYDRYFSDVFRYVRYRVGEDAAAEDIASEVFVRMLESARSGRPPATHLRAWLLGTAAHMTADHFRKAYRRPSTGLPEDLPDQDDSLPLGFEDQERARQLKTALAALTEDQQHVIGLRFNLGLSLEETAQMMKKNVNTIKQLQLRALAALNRRMGGVS